MVCSEVTGTDSHKREFAMPSNPTNADNGQAIVSLKEYVDTRIEDLTTRCLCKISDMEKAVVVATAQMDRRLEGMNEFRNQLKDQAGTFVYRPEYTAAHLRLAEDVQGLRLGQSNFVTRVEHQAIHDRVDADIRSLQLTRANIEGKASMTSVFIAYGISVVSLIVAIIGLMDRFIK